MGTLITIHVIRTGNEVDRAIDRAFGWFHEIEQRCTRFNDRSELMQIAAQPGLPVPVSAIVYEAVTFALLMAEESGGAFDPTVGHRMQARGFNQDHRTGAQIGPLPKPDPDVSYRDVLLDPDRRTITLRRPLILDLGAVAKGLAVDAAARELERFVDFAIDAGGDLYLAGTKEHGTPWSVGIRHPRHENELITTLQVSDQAICTSGDYERRAPCGEHHIIEPRTGQSPSSVASATVVAPRAMLADALATAVFVLGPIEGLQLLDRAGVQGLIVTQDLQRYATGGLLHAA